MVEQVANNPASQLLAETLGYTLWWGSELGFWVWLVLFWALWLGLGGLAGVLLARTSVGGRCAARGAAGAADGRERRPACRWPSPGSRAWRSWERR